MGTWARVRIGTKWRKIARVVIAGLDGIWFRFRSNWGDRRIGLIGQIQSIEIGASVVAVEIYEFSLNQEAAVTAFKKPNRRYPGIKGPALLSCDLSMDCSTPRCMQDWSEARLTQLTGKQPSKIVEWLPQTLRTSLNLAYRSQISMCNGVDSRYGLPDHAWSMRSYALCLSSRWRALLGKVWSSAADCQAALARLVRIAGRLGTTWPASPEGSFRPGWPEFVCSQALPDATESSFSSFSSY